MECLLKWNAETSRAIRSDQTPTRNRETGLATPSSVERQTEARVPLSTVSTMDCAASCGCLPFCAVKLKPTGKRGSNRIYSVLSQRQPASRTVASLPCSRFCAHRRKQPAQPVGSILCYRPPASCDDRDWLTPRDRQPVFPKNGEPVLIREPSEASRSAHTCAAPPPRSCEWRSMTTARAIRKVAQRDQQSEATATGGGRAVVRHVRDDNGDFVACTDELFERLRSDRIVYSAC